jgi:5'-nucleotidase (lipoprotein e(P4) family)
MKRLFLLIIPLMIGCNNPSGNNNNCNTDLEHLVMSTIWFQRSPEAAALYHQGFNIAKERVVEFKSQAGKKPQAVVVDIDETMMSNALFQAKAIERGISYSSEFWKEWSDLAIASALPGAVEFSNFCDSLDIEVIYISNRKDKELEATMRNLDSLGFAFVRSENLLLRTTKSGKEERRIKVTEKYDIIMLLGDNLNDFSDVFENRGEDWGLSLVEKYRSEFGRRFIVFPNPMYGEWEKNIYGEERDQPKSEMFRKRRSALESY